MQLLAGLYDHHPGRRRGEHRPSCAPPPATPERRGRGLRGPRECRHRRAPSRRPHLRCAAPLHDHGRAPNVHDVAVKGAFDDCQAIVKALFGNSFAGHRPVRRQLDQLRAHRRPDRLLLLRRRALGAPAAGLLRGAHRQFRRRLRGLRRPADGPADRAAHRGHQRQRHPPRALSTGDYSAGTVTPTATPAMDIQVSSNFERLLFDLDGRDGAALDAAMRGFERDRHAAARQPREARRPISRARASTMARWSRRCAGRGTCRPADRSAHRDRPCRRAAADRR